MDMCPNNRGERRHPTSATPVSFNADVRRRVYSGEVLALRAYCARRGWDISSESISEK